MKEKLHVNNSNDAEKTFDKNPTHFHDKSAHKTRNIRELPQMTKEIYEKPTANIILNAERLKALP